MKLVDRRKDIIQRIGFTRYIKIRQRAIGIIELCNDYIITDAFDPSGNIETFIDYDENLIISIIEDLLEGWKHEKIKKCSNI